MTDRTIKLREHHDAMVLPTGSSAASGEAEGRSSRRRPSSNRHIVTVIKRKGDQPITSELVAKCRAVIQPLIKKTSDAYWGTADNPQILSFNKAI